jgi:hypothetical protein
MPLPRSAPVVEYDLAVPIYGSFPAETYVPVPGNDWNGAIALKN